MAPAPTASAAGCEVKLGFKLIADQMPDALGGCLEDEHYNPLNGDSLQRTANGLLVWRKLDNFTAFTDGYRSWVNGPFSIQQRLNTERFDWEPISAPAAPIAAAPVPAPAAVAFPAPTITFTIDNTTIAAGQCVTARWNVANAGAVYLLGTGADTVGMAGTGDRLVCPTASTSYTLNVVDLGGATTARVITVSTAGYVTPTVSFTADRTTINVGECTTVRWNVSNVKAVYLRGPDVDTGVAGQGDRSLCPRTTSTYRLDVVDLSSATTSPNITVNVQGIAATPTPVPAVQPTPTGAASATPRSG
jgi:hypothetical protein